MFKNRQVLGTLHPQRPLIFNIGDLKFHNLTKLCFFYYDEIELQKYSYDVILVT